MKTAITILFTGEFPSSITPERIVEYEGAVAIPGVGDQVSRIIYGQADYLKGEVVARQFSYFDDQVRVVLTVRAE